MFRTYVLVLDQDMPSTDVTGTLYVHVGDAEMVELDRTQFGPFDVASDVTRWITRHLHDAALFPLR